MHGGTVEGQFYWGTNCHVVDCGSCIASALARKVRAVSSQRATVGAAVWYWMSQYHVSIGYGVEGDGGRHEDGFDCRHVEVL